MKTENFFFSSYTASENKQQLENVKWNGKSKLKMCWTRNVSWAATMKNSGHASLPRSITQFGHRVFQFLPSQQQTHTHTHMLCSSSLSTFGPADVRRLLLFAGLGGGVESSTNTIYDSAFCSTKETISRNFERLLIHNRPQIFRKCPHILCDEILSAPHSSSNRCRTSVSSWQWILGPAYVLRSWSCHIVLI